MNDDNQTAIAIAVIVGLTVIGSMAIGFYSYNSRLKTAMENGYEEGSLPGQAATAWVKVKKE